MIVQAVAASVSPARFFNYEMTANQSTSGEIGLHQEHSEIALWMRVPRHIGTEHNDAHQ